MLLSILPYGAIKEICRAAEGGDKALSLLLKFETEGWIDGQDEEGRTALHHVVMWNSGTSQRVITTLINLGADPNKQNKDGETPLHLALFNHCVLMQGKGAEEQVMALLKGRADPMIEIELARPF